MKTLFFVTAMAMMLLFSCSNDEPTIPCQPSTIFAVADSARTNPDVPVTIDFTKNDQLCGIDASSLQVSIYKAPSNGTAALQGHVITYTPAPGFIGNDTVVYKIASSNNSSLGIISIQVKEMLDIYLVGTEFLPNGNNNGLATYWKNGVPIHLTDGTKDAIANSIVVSGNDVYIAGTEGDQAVYWKNGVKTILTGNRNNGYATNGIAISGNDLYIGGTEFETNTTLPNQNHTVALYWKNNTPIYLTADTTGSWTSSLVVSDNDVYVTGAIYGTKDVAVYWKNQQVVYLTNPEAMPMSIAIAVSGPDVYVAGVLFGQIQSQAGYWKNGDYVLLLDEGSSWLGANGVMFTDGDLYIWGTTNGDGNTYSNALYWKNGIPVHLTNNPSGSGYTWATGMAVSSNAVYAVVNHRTPDNLTTIPTVLKNGNVIMTIVDNTRSNARVQSIYLVKQ